MGKSKARNGRGSSRAAHVPAPAPAPPATNTFGMSKAQFELFEASKARLGLPDNFNPSDITRAQFEASKALLGFPDGFDPSALFNRPGFLSGTGGATLDLDGEVPAWLTDGILGLDAAHMLAGRGDPKAAMAEGYAAGRAAGLAAGLQNGKSSSAGSVANGKRPANSVGGVSMTSAAAGLMGMNLGLAASPSDPDADTGGLGDSHLVPVSDKALLMLNHMLGSRGMMQRDPETGAIDVLLNAEHFPEMPLPGAVPVQGDATVKDIRDIFQSLTDTARKGLGDGTLPSLDDLLKLPIFNTGTMRSGPVISRAELALPVGQNHSSNGKASQRGYVHTATIDIPIPIPPNFPGNTFAPAERTEPLAPAANVHPNGSSAPPAQHEPTAPDDYHPDEDDGSHLDEFELDLEDGEEEEYDEDDYETDEEEYEDAEGEEGYEDEDEEAYRTRLEMEAERHVEQMYLDQELAHPGTNILDDPDRLNWAVSELFAWIKWSVDQQIVKPARQARRAREEAALLAQQRAARMEQAYAQQEYAQAQAQAQAQAGQPRQEAAQNQVRGPRTRSDEPPTKKKKKRS